MDVNESQDDADEVSPRGARRIYRVLCHLAASDGSIAPSERAKLEHYRITFGIDADEGRAIEAAGVAGEGLMVGKSAVERDALVESMIDVATADGKLERIEQLLLVKFAKVAGFPLELLKRAVTRKLLERRPPEERSPGSDDSDVPELARTPAGLGMNFVVLLDVTGEQAQIGCASATVPAGFRGFAHVPDGLWRIAVRDDERTASTWVRLEGFAAVVKAHDRGALVDADRARTEQYAALATRGAMTRELLLFPRSMNDDWAILTASLLRREFPPVVHERDPEGGTRLERALFGTHRGDGVSFLAEMSFAFVDGIFDQRARSRARWEHLLDACFHCGESLPRARPRLFVAIARLVGAQLAQLPRSFAEFPNALYLVEDLADTEEPELVAASRELVARLAERPS